MRDGLTAQATIDTDAEKADRLIAIEILRERLDANVTEANIAHLAKCFTDIEHNACELKNEVVENDNEAE